MEQRNKLAQSTWIQKAKRIQRQPFHPVFDTVYNQTAGMQLQVKICALQWRNQWRKIRHFAICRHYFSPLYSSSAVGGDVTGKFQSRDAIDSLSHFVTTIVLRSFHCQLFCLVLQHFDGKNFSLVLLIMRKTRLREGHLIQHSTTKVGRV